MRFIALALIACSLAIAAHAERADREKEIVLGADRALANDNDKSSVLQGNVVVTQGTMRITADRLTLKEDGKGNKFYVAYGAPVTFRQKRDNVDEWVEGFAQRAEFDDSSDVLKLFNRARVKSNQSEITGEFISYDINKSLAEVTGAPPGTSAPSGLPSRVKMVIIPAKKAPEGAAADQPAPGVTLKPETGMR